MIWFSVSCICTSLPNSVGLLALPLRIISLCGSKQTHDLAWQLRHSIEHAGLGLLHHLPHQAAISDRCSHSPRNPFFFFANISSTSAMTCLVSLRICRE